MSVLKPLIISRNYRFDHSPGGECLRAFVGAMNTEEWQPIIYGSDRPPLVGKICDNECLTHEKITHKYTFAAIRRFFPDVTYLPGYEWQAWGKGVVKDIKRDLTNNHIAPDYIHSVSFPVASHWAALTIKKHTNLPWVMQFYDPWADNPYRVFKTKSLKKRDWAQEREAVEAADLIIHDNQVIANLWKKRYGSEIGGKIVVLPLTVPLQKSEYLLNYHKTGDLLTISHIGNFMLNRTSLPFIQAVAELIKRHPEYSEKLRINYIGTVTKSEKDLIKKYDLTRIFNLVGIMSAEDCIDYYQRSDLFIAIDGVNDNNLFFPSKILKYLYFRRPILGITPKGSVLEFELQNAGHISLENRNIDGIVNYLERAINDYESLLRFDYDYWLRFEPENVISLYRSIINDLLSDK